MSSCVASFGIVFLVLSTLVDPCELMVARIQIRTAQMVSERHKCESVRRTIFLLSVSFAGVLTAWCMSKLYWRFAFWKYMLDSQIVMVKVSAMERWCSSDKPLPRRQDLSSDEYDTVKLCSRRRHFCISHPWFTPHHPDPCGHQLVQLVALLRKLNAKPNDLVFYDYCCLYQEIKSHPEWNESLWRTQPGHPSLRTAHQHELFQQAMVGMHLLYTSSCVDVIIIPNVPNVDVVTNTMPYDRRGWCFFELCICTAYDRALVTSPETELLLEDRFPRGPLSERAFCEQFDQTRFTNSGDRETVLVAYAKLQRRMYSNFVLEAAMSIPAVTCCTYLTREVLYAIQNGSIIVSMQLGLILIIVAAFVLLQWWQSVATSIILTMPKVQVAFFIFSLALITAMNPTSTWRFSPFDVFIWCLELFIMASLFWVSLRVGTLCGIGHYIYRRMVLDRRMRGPPLLADTRLPEAP